MANEMPPQFTLRRLPSTKRLGGCRKPRSQSEDMQQPVDIKTVEIAPVSFGSLDHEPVHYLHFTESEGPDASWHKRFDHIVYCSNPVDRSTVEVLTPGGETTVEVVLHWR